MATQSLARDLQDEATCPICLDLFSEPVSLGCGHNFCRACVDRSRGVRDAPFPCPECREPCVPGSLRPNRPLGRVAAALGRLGPAQGREESCDLCKEHLEPLKLFCHSDHSLICVVCDRSREHRTHRVVPLEEAAQTYREVFPKILQELKKEMKKALKLQAEGKERQTTYVKVQERKQRTVFQFKKFRNLLAEEELLVLQELEKEETEMMEVLKEEERALTGQTHDVEELISELQERMMVTLDPESAHSRLTVSKDKRAVLQDKPWHGQSTGEELFGRFPSVLGSEQLSTGRHYWEVEVRDGGSWFLGVCKEDANREVSPTWTPDNGFWSKGDLIPTGVFRPQKTRYPRIGVFLDYEAGELSFYNVNEEYHIYTFPQACFTGPLRPIFITPSWCQTCLTICLKQRNSAKDVPSAGKRKFLKASTRSLSKPSLFVFGDASASNSNVATTGSL
ncbi:PREDICTED: E3 ubiquitin-protein ligase TRIM11-like [Chrysochloris asiatica]|uniref:E3 ubiquitin-protein ligase TRIM11-like n=1 Tax=Chrysochloris asiatica TaxID=185453 RepID=A0A9B0U552_CHRAS|nr:PREDICTED: E3 ubiquitin-protein ligase TRIM11-like [Chrysochloris asiatica]